MAATGGGSSGTLELLRLHQQTSHVIMLQRPADEPIQIRHHALERFARCGGAGLTYVEQPHGSGVVMHFES